MDRIEYLCGLANVDLSRDEKTRLSSDLDEILGFFDILGKLDLSSEEPLRHVLGVKNVMGEDIPAEFPERSALVENFPERDGNYLSVGRIINDAEDSI